MSRASIIKKIASNSDHSTKALDDAMDIFSKRLPEITNNVGIKDTASKIKGNVDALSNVTDESKAILKEVFFRC